MNITQLLEMTTKHKASDLHLCIGYPPVLRVQGQLQKLGSHILNEDQITSICYQLTTPEQRETLMQQLDLDFAYHLHDIGRFRINIFTERRGFALALRSIPETIPDLTHYRNFETLRNLLAHRNGLILVTGTTGSGKSTTMAAMTEFLNQRESLHIITLEDPIEFLYQGKRSMIQQREVERDVKSFAQGLRAALREDPDLIVLGELRDLESIRLALNAAETGHLVLASLHANSAAKAIDRLIDSFAGDEKTLIQMVLSEALAGIIHQSLITRKENTPLELIQEIMINTPAIKNLIREHKIAQIEATMETSQHLGMKTLAQAMRELE